MATMEGGIADFNLDHVLHFKLTVMPQQYNYVHVCENMFAFIWGKV